MGLQGHICDISSDSIPLLLIAHFVTCLSRLRSLLLPLLRFLGVSAPQFDHEIADDDESLPSLGGGDGLARLSLLAHQLTVNRLFSFRYGGGGESSDCVVCMCGLRDGDRVRMLACRHVFHKECFDGWLDCLNFTCPLCRSSVVSDQRVVSDERRLSGDIARWFSLR